MKGINIALFVAVSLFALSLISGAQGCESNHFYGSATAVIISVDKDDVIGTDIKTTVVFEDGQVESLWRMLGDEGDRLFFERIQMRKSDSTITYIPRSSTIKNVTKGYAQYGKSH